MIIDHSTKSDKHNYCKYRCNEIINRIENIRNYSCYTDCIKSVKNVIVIKPIPPPPNFGKWKPKLHDKCDYMPNGDVLFIPCVVVGIEQIGKINFAKIEFVSRNGHKSQLNVEYPNKKFLKCGEGIRMRKDCN